MKKKKTPAPAVVSDAQDFPKYYKNGSRFTRVDSKSQFTEIWLARSHTRITSGNNLHIIDDAINNDVPSDRDAFIAAYKNALQKISSSLN